MIGEIRDFETAEIAVKAALDRPPGAVDPAHQRRPLDHHPAAEHGRRAVPGDRLGERRCRPSVWCGRSAPTARQPTDTPKDELRLLGAKDEEIDTATCFKGAGCERCNNTGYKGRIAVYEVMPFNEPLRELVLQGASSVELKAEAIRQGMRTLRMSGVTKVCQGVTTFDEVGRITAAD